MLGRICRTTCDSNNIFKGQDVSAICCRMSA
jgi:hypothetical protein